MLWSRSRLLPLGINTLLFTPQAVSGPGNAPAVVAVGGGDEAQVLDLFVDGRFLQFGERHVFDGKAQLPGQIVGDAEAAAQPLECVQPEAIAFVFHVQGPDAQFLGQAFQISQRCGGIARDGLMEVPGGFCHFFRKRPVPPAVVRGLWDTILMVSCMMVPSLLSDILR